MPITGSLINIAAIAAGVIVGLRTHRDLAPDWQIRLRKILGIFTVWFGWNIMWKGMNGSFGQVTRQVALVLVALMLGKLTGRCLRLQKSFNRLGRFAKQQLLQPTQPAKRASAGFLACTIIYCAAPLSILGALQEGIEGDLRPLIVKALMDGLAAVSFSRTLGLGTGLSVLPVLAYQGSLAILGQYLEPMLRHAGWIDSVELTIGFMIFCVSLVILELKKVELADYLPSLIIAPLLTAWAK